MSDTLKRYLKIIVPIALMIFLLYRMDVHPW